MPIRQTAKKYDFEYESPDGDVISISYVKNDDREYVELCQIGESGTEFARRVFDLEMFLDITDELRKITRQTQAHSPTIPAPQVTDHRADMIDAQVKASMEKQDGSVSPIQSFSPQTQTEELYNEVRTGVNPYGLEGLEETPEDLKSGSWTDDVKNRAPKEIPTEKKIKKAGGHGVGADQLI